MTQPFYINKKEGMTDIDTGTKWKNPKYNFTIKTNDSQRNAPNYSNIQLPIINVPPIITDIFNGVNFSDSVNLDKPSESYIQQGSTQPLSNIVNTVNVEEFTTGDGRQDTEGNTSQNPQSNPSDPFSREKYPEVSVNDTDMIGLNARETRIEYTQNESSPYSYFMATKHRNLLQRDDDPPPQTNGNGGSTTSFNITQTDNTHGNSNDNNANPPIEISQNQVSNNITKRFNAFYADKTSKNAKLLAITILENIPELFFIPEMIAVGIVRSSTPNNKRSGPDYSQNIFKLTYHFKSYMTMLISIYITFNWWYLMLYTDHYIDFFNLLKSPLLIPFIWIVGPVLTPFANLNYYLLGKRLEPAFYTKYVEPVLKNKPYYLSLLLCIIVVFYDKIIDVFISNMKSLIDNKNDDQFLFIIIAVGAAMTFMYSVVFNEEKNTNLIQKAGFALSILFYIIMFIVIMLLCKAISGLILIYLMFYSFFFLLIS